MCACSCLAQTLCQQGAGVGRHPCVSRCPSVWPSVCRLRPLCANARQSWGARFFFLMGGGGYLMGINHGREWRAGGRKSEGEGVGVSWLIAHLHPRSLLPWFFYLLSVSMLMSCYDAWGGRSRGTQTILHTLPCLF